MRTVETRQCNSVCGNLGCKSGDERERGESAWGILGMAPKMEGLEPNACEKPLSEAGLASRSVKDNLEAAWK